MPQPRLRFTNRALGMIRALREPAFSQAHRLLAAPADAGDTRQISVKVQGRDGLYRAKVLGSRLRAAWAFDAADGAPVVDSVVVRSDTTYSADGDLLRGVQGAAVATALDVLDREPHAGDPADDFEYWTDDQPAFAYDRLRLRPPSPTTAFAYDRLRLRPPSPTTGATAPPSSATTSATSLGHPAFLRPKRRT